MKRGWILAGLGTAVLVGAVGGAARPPDPSTPDVDYREIARKLVHQSARVRDGEFVLINGGTRDLELLEDIAVATRRVGGWPLVTIGSDRMARLLYDNVPADFDTRRPELAVRLVGLFPVNINVDFTDNTGVLDGVSPERINARAAAAQPVGDLAREFNVRTVNLGNGLYPTPQRARMFDVSLEWLDEMFWSAVNTEYGELERVGAMVRDLINAGHQVRITNPNGTDLTVQLGGATSLVSDGIISADDERRGGAATTVWLPAGEVYVAPLRGTATGVVVVDRHFFQGHTIEGLRLEFERGMLTEMSAERGLEYLQPFYDAAGEGKDEFGVVDIGLNPNVTIPAGSRLVSWVAGGMVTVGVGNNAWAGGSNNANWAIYPFLPGSTVMIDETVVVEGGVLQVATEVGGR